MITARQKGEEWYVGTMTNESGRALDVPLQFLAPGKRKGRSKANRKNDGQKNTVPKGPKYVAEIYSDGIDAEYDTNLTDVRIDKAIVDPSTMILASVVGSGGQAIRLRRARGEDMQKLPTYERPTQQYESISVPETAYTSSPFTVTITGSHSGDFIGGEELNVYANGEQIDTVLVRFTSESEKDSFEVTISDPGEYDLTVGRSLNDALPVQTVTVRDPYATELPAQYSTYSSAPAEFGRIEDTLLINAAGEDVESYADEYGTIYVNDGLETSGTVTTTISKQESTNTYAKAGIMVKNDITQAGNSTGYVLIATSPGLGPFMHADLNGDGYVDTFYGANVPYEFPTHLRLEKEGDTFTGSASVDGGETFTEITRLDIPSAANTQDAGLFVTSHNTGTKSQVQFPEFSVENSN